MKAKIKTKAREEDLHIAVDKERVNEELTAVFFFLGGGYTVESERDKLQTHIAQSDVQARSCSTGAYTSEVEPFRHPSLLLLLTLSRSVVAPVLVAYSREVSGA